MVKYNEILYVLSGDTTVLYSLLAEVPEIVSKAQEVASGTASYNDLLELSYDFF